MKAIYYITCGLVLFVSFASLYLSFEYSHQTADLYKQIDSLSIRQDKLEYMIEHKKDTIIINNYFKIK